MFKTIFSKLLVTYLVIMLVVLTALALVISEAYNRYVFSEKHKNLLNAAAKVNELVDSYMAGGSSKKELESSLDSLGYITDSKIYIIRMDRQSLSDPANVKLGEGLEEAFLIDDLKSILDGRPVYRKNQYSGKFDMYMVFTGVPWKTEKGIEGAILLFSPVDHIAENLQKIDLTIALTSLVFMVVSAVVIYIFSLRISRPVKKMETAASRLAEGENAEDLPVTSRDELGKLAKTFNFMKEQLMNTEKMRREFIANVSHDLRTPLTSIGGFVEGMLDGVIGPKDYEKSLRIIQEETARLTRLTSDILQLAKIQAGTVILKKEHLKVESVVYSVLESATPFLEEKQIRLTVECGSGLSVFADSDRLKQVLLNLVSNAVKYSDSGASLLIRAWETASETCFSVIDTGIGIPADQLPFIFEKFYRVDKVRHSAQSGTGLGLNIVKSLIGLHGGRIRAVSELGRGTEIHFELPKEKNEL